jgi:hypothetical protein
LPHDIGASIGARRECKAKENLEERGIIAAIAGDEEARSTYSVHRHDFSRFECNAD